MVYLFYLYFLSLLSSISIMDGTTSIMAIILVVQFIKIKTTKKVSENPSLHPIFFPLKILPFFIFWAVWELIGFWINQPKVHWLNAYMNLRWMMFIPIVAWTMSLMKLEKYLKIEKIKWLYIPFLVTAIYALLPAIFGYDPIQPHRTDLQPISVMGGIRAQGFFDNPMTFGHAFGVMYCLMVALGLYTFQNLKNQISKWDYYGILITVLLSGLALTLSYTRGALFSVAVAIFVICYLFNPKWGKWFITIFVSVLILLFYTQPAFQNRIQTLLQYEQTQNERITLWKANWLMFKDHPVFGVAHGENHQRLDEYYDKMGVPQTFFKSHAHNQFLHFLSGTGFVGFLCYTSFLIYLFITIFRSWRQIHKSSEDIFAKIFFLAAIAAIIHIILGGLFEANYEDTETVHCFCFLIAMYFYLKRTMNLLTN